MTEPTPGDDTPIGPRPFTESRDHAILGINNAVDRINQRNAGATILDEQTQVNVAVLASLAHLVTFAPTPGLARDDLAIAVNGHAAEISGEMVDRAAEAIFDAHYWPGNETWDDEPEYGKEAWRHKARAALTAAGKRDDVAKMLDGLIGTPGILTPDEHAGRIYDRIMGYRAAVATGAVCGSDAVTGGCVRYPDHGDGHSMYPLPGDPTYPGSVTDKAMRQAGLQVTGEITGATIIRNNGAHHVVADIEPSAWKWCRVITRSGEQVIQIAGEPDITITPAQAHTFAAELLSAFARVGAPS